MRRRTRPIDSFERSGYQRREPSVTRRNVPRQYAAAPSQGNPHQYAYRGEPARNAPRAGSVYRQPPAQRGRYRNPRARRRRVLALSLLACAALIAVVVGVRLNDYHQARQEYAEYTIANNVDAKEPQAPTQPPAPTELLPAVAVAEATSTPVPTPTPEPFYSETVRQYMRQNGDTVAYLDVLDTNVQYPVVQREDNEYYVTHTFAGKRRVAGAIFMDAWNSYSFTDFNTVIYGHNMKDGSMFSDLREYRHHSFLSEHKYIEVTLLSSKRTYKVFAAYVVEDGFDFRGFANTSQAEKGAFIKQIMRRSEIKTNTEATADDTLLTLVTCTSGDHDWFWIVHAVLIKEITTKQ